jgi:hypothetical protein
MHSGGKSSGDNPPTPFILKYVSSLFFLSKLFLVSTVLHSFGEDFTKSIFRKNYEIEWGLKLHKNSWKPTCGQGKIPINSLTTFPLVSKIPSKQLEGSLKCYPQFNKKRSLR